MFFNLPNNLDDISKIIQKYDVISFDIYDTLICRRFLKPRDVFKFIELNENVKYFYTTRVWAERIARHLLMKKKGEITLNDIYKYMPPKMKYETILHFGDSTVSDIEKAAEYNFHCKYFVII